jgi:uncharacterized protein
MSSFRKPGKRFAIISAAALVLVLVAIVGVGWYYSSLLHSGALTPDYTPDKLNLRVVSVESDRIVLTERKGENVDDLTADELSGLQGESGYGQVSDILAVDGDEVTRRFQLLSGSISEGDFVRLDSFAFRGDPLTARGLDFHNVSVPSPLGDFPAWKLDGSPSTWVILVHGWRVSREEALRILPTFSDLGLSSLVITYRNDQGVPPSPDGLIRWGATEWQDLDAAVVYAESQGAKSIVLYGYSMGGGIVTRFLEQSENAGVVTGAVLDAPVLDFDALLHFQAGQRGIPGFLVWWGKQFAGRRYDLDWAAMDPLKDVDRLKAPILVFHGDDDDRAPIKTSEQLAAQRSDIVTFYIVPTAGHVRSWNVDPSLYEQRVRDFLINEVGIQGQ